IVKAETGPYGARDFEEIHNRLCAVMPGSDGNPHLIQDSAYVIGVYSLYIEGDHGSLLPGRAIYLQPLYGKQLSSCIFQQFVFIAGNGFHPDPVEVVKGSPESDPPANIGSPGFKLMRQAGIGGF